MKVGRCQAIHVVVLGTGSIGTRHLRVLDQMLGVRPIAVPKHRERAKGLADQGRLTAREVSEAVKMGATLGIVATDTGEHLQDGLLTLESGLDVLVEKPLATNACEANRLARCAKDTGHKLFVGCVLRFSESLNTFRKLLGEAGHLHSVRIECQSYLPDWRPTRPYQNSYSARVGEGGVLLDLVHEIDYAGWLFGWPTALQASIRNLGRLGIAAEEIAELTWEAPGGCLVSVSLDYLSRPPRRQMRACGERGIIEWDGIACTTTAMVDGEPCGKIGASQTRDEMFLAQDRAFINTICGNPDPRLATGEEGVKALAVCDAARRASDNRREEIVEYQ